MGFGIGLVGALASYALGLAGVAVMALVASRLAAMFEGEQDIVQAFKLVAYAATPGWIGGLFRLVPGLAVLSMLMSLYSIYLIYTGAQAVMAVPQDRTLGDTTAGGAPPRPRFLLSPGVIPPPRGGQKVRDAVNGRA